MVLPSTFGTSYAYFFLNIPQTLPSDFRANLTNSISSMTHYLLIFWRMWAHIWVRSITHHRVLALGFSQKLSFSRDVKIIGQCLVSLVLTIIRIWCICKLWFSHILFMIILLSKKADPFWTIRIFAIQVIRPVVALGGIHPIALEVGLIWLRIKIRTRVDYSIVKSTRPHNSTIWVILVIQGTIWLYLIIKRKISTAITAVLEDISHCHALGSNRHVSIDWLKFFGPTIIEQLII